MKMLLFIARNKNLRLDKRLELLNNEFEKQLDIFSISLDVFYKKLKVMDSILKKQHHILNAPL